MRMLGFSETEERRADAASSPREGAGLAVEPEDFVRYGIIPEMIGRLPITVSLNSLTEDDLVRILTDPKNCLVKQYRKLMAMEKAELIFTEGALRELARVAIKKGTGARALRSTIEKIMTDVFFDLGREVEGRTIRITKRMVERERYEDEPEAARLKKAS